MKCFKILFLLLFTLSVHAQELYFKPSQAFQNILSFETYVSFQDSKGIIWVSSDAGINRYDGNSTTSYTTKDGLPENGIFKIYEDRKGRIWFSTLNGMLCYFENNSFHSIAANLELQKLGKRNSSLYWYVGKDDTLYYSSVGFSGVAKISPGNNYKKIVVSCTEQIKKSFITFLTNPLKPTEGIVTMSDYYHYHVNHITHTILWDDKIYRVPYDYASNIYSNIWRLKLNHLGNKLYAPCGLELAVLKKNDTTVQHHFVDKEIIYVYDDNDGDLWILCKRGGGYLYKRGDLTSKPIHFLNNLSVSSVMIDREGTIWATTLEKGVFTCNSKNILSITNQENDQVTNFQTDNNRLVAPYFSKKIISFFKDDRVSIDTAECVYDPEYYLRAYYQGKDYFYYNRYGASFYVKPQNNKNSKQVSLDTRLVLKDFIHYKGDTVLGLSPSGLVVLCRQKRVFSIKPYSPLNCIHILKDNTVLIGCRDGNGILEFKNNRLTPYYPHLQKLRVRINAIAEDKRKRIWLATENGVMCLDEKKILHEYRKKGAPLNLKMNALTIDENENIWCSDGSSLIRIEANSDLNNLSITTFNTNHGLPDTRIDKLASFDNNIYCATKGFLFYFNRESLKKNTTPPFTQLKSIFINGLEHSVSDTITVAHNQNNISVEAITTTYKSNEPKTFFYKLEGYDTEWNSLNKGNIQYTNLDHGTYRLFVYSLNNDGMKGAPVSITLIIKRPFWFTWWFILIEVIVAGIIFYYFLNVWRRRIEKKEQEKAKTEQEKTKMNQKITEFKMTALRSQMNPHFIFNAIGSIQHFILQNEAKQSYNYLAKFSMLIRNILNNSREEYISLEQEITTLRLYIELEQIRFETPFHFIIDVDETLDLEMDIPTMLIQPYVENSIWHGLMPKATKGILELLFKKIDGELHVTIRDNGVGRKKKDPLQKHISRGMSITEQRIETLESTSQKKFKTDVVDLKDEQGNPIGTEVNIIIPMH